MPQKDDSVKAKSYQHENKTSIDRQIDINSAVEYQRIQASIKQTYNMYSFKGLADPKDSVLMYYFCIGNVMVLKVYYSIMEEISKVLLFFLRQ